MIVSGRVVYAFVYYPIDALGLQFHAVQLEQGPRYLSRERPTVFDEKGQPIALTMEIPPGSEVKLHVEGRKVLAVKVLKMNITDPFQDS